jgi:hypothetical protein
LYKDSRDLFIFPHIRAQTGIYNTSSNVSNAACIVEELAVFRLVDGFEDGVEHVWEISQREQLILFLYLMELEQGEKRRSEFRSVFRFTKTIHTWNCVVYKQCFG